MCGEYLGQVFFIMAALNQHTCSSPDVNNCADSFLDFLYFFFFLFFLSFFFFVVVRYEAIVCLCTYNHAL